MPMRAGLAYIYIYMIGLACRGARCPPSIARNDAAQHCEGGADSATRQGVAHSAVVRGGAHAGE